MPSSSLDSDLFQCTALDARLGTRREQPTPLAFEPIRPRRRDAREGGATVRRAEFLALVREAVSGRSAEGGREEVPPALLEDVAARAYEAWKAEDVLDEGPSGGRVTGAVERAAKDVRVATKASDLRLRLALEPSVRPSAPLPVQDAPEADDVVG